MILQSYEVIDIDENGWMVGKPRPEAEKLFVEITNELLAKAVDGGASIEMGDIFSFIGKKARMAELESQIESLTTERDILAKWLDDKRGLTGAAQRLARLVAKGTA